MGSIHRTVALLAAATLAGCASGTSGAGPVASGPRPLPPAARGTTAADTAAGAASEAAGRNERIRELASAASAGGGATASRSAYRVGPDDLLGVNVFGAPELSGEHRVSSGGEIAVPLLGPVAVEGLSPREVEDKLEGALGRDYMKDPHVTVEVVEMQSHGVSVVGAVRKPGVYQISGSATLLDVLARAQGLDDNAGGTVVVTRGGSASEPSPSTGDSLPAGGSPSDSGAAARQIDLKALLSSGDLSLNVPVRPGDVVKVPTAGRVYVTGQVQDPGGFPVTNGETMTALQALSLGGGLTERADAGDAYVIRVHQDGRREQVPLDLGKVLDGESEDPRLLAGDVLFVPRSTGKTIFGGLFDAVIRMVTLGTLVR